jgi:AcrR family transcriptional regulator
VNRREREKEETRRKILDAARELFVELGYEAVTMRKIAEKIGYSPTAIYFHFKDKEALIRDLCEHDFRSLAAQFVRIAKIADPIERLRKAGLAYLEFALEHPNQYRLMFMTPSPLPNPVEDTHIQRGNPEEDAYAFLQWTILQAIDEGRLRPELRDGEMMAQAAWASLHGLASLYIAKGENDWVDWRPLRGTARHLIDVMLRGIERQKK